MNIYQKLFLLLLTIISLNSSAQTTDKKAANKKSATTYTFKIINAPSNTFGYDIYVDGRLKIHQPFIPAIPGSNGFKTKRDAEKVAKLAIRKIRQGQIPPAITKEEMKKLKVL